MYHPSKIDSLSTGEPPTPPVDSLTSVDPESRTIAPVVQSQTTSESQRDRSQSLTAQEQDSGYEASPCSIATNSCSDLHFFAPIRSPATSATSVTESEDLGYGQAANDDPVLPPDDDVFEASPYLLLEHLEDRYLDNRPLASSSHCVEQLSSASAPVHSPLRPQGGDEVFHICHSCGAHTIVPRRSSCHGSLESRPSPLRLEHMNSHRRCHSCCCCRASTANRLGADGQTGDCDIPNSNESSSYARPSSLPIEIPTPDPHVSATPRTTQRTLLAPFGFLRVPPMQSSPNLRPESGARPSAAVSRTWPSFSFPSIFRRREASPSPAVQPEAQSRLNRQIPRTERSRLRLIDSDASSADESMSEANDLTESDDEIFIMAEEDTSPTPRVSPLEHLPDIILHSSPAIIRRNRSVSINLPLDSEVIQHVGRSLRRLSDQFEMRREELLRNCPRRRGTMDSIYRRSS